MYALPHLSMTQMQPSSKAKRRLRLSKLLFYSIFAVGIFLIPVMELLFLRLDQFKPSPHRLGPRNDYVVVQAKGRQQGIGTEELPLSPKSVQTTSSMTLMKETDLLIDYPGGKQLYSGRSLQNKHATMKFTHISVPTEYHRINHWVLDPLNYTFEESKRKVNHPRVICIGQNTERVDTRTKKVEPYSDSDVGDVKQYTSAAPDYVDVSESEMRSHSNKECVPTKDWQTAYYPTCNDFHQMDFIQQSHPNLGGDMHLFGTNGYWRNAWKIDYSCTKRNSTHISGCNETVVLKTMKFQHSFEHANYEHDRVDAMAMERLTSSPHVINIFGSCGNSVVTEFADGERVGTLADKKKKIPLERLKIARDIASGLADVHSIDGDTEATFVHFDVNLANVVSIGGRLKLNDFNIGVMLKRNQTSGKSCGFPAQYPNPQWRSPEEANESQHLTEKVDVFSLGHIFFRLICLHEPWHKLEPGYKKGNEIQKEYVNEQVKKGVLPTIPKEVMETKDAEVRVIREAMLSCYTYDPKMRPSARTIANFLDRGLEELSKHSFLRRAGNDHWGSFRLGKK